MATAIEAIFVQDDTSPEIAAQLHEELNESVPVDLNGCTVKFQMRKPDDREFTVDAAATITNPAEGLVSYTWAPGDLHVFGEYDVQWQVTYGDGKKQTTTLPNRILVRRR